MYNDPYAPAQYNQYGMQGGPPQNQNWGGSQPQASPTQSSPWAPPAQPQDQGAQQLQTQQNMGQLANMVGSAVANLPKSSGSGGGSGSGGILNLIGGLFG